MSASALKLPASRRIAWWRKLNPLWVLFGNEDDPLPPDSHEPGMPILWRRVTWWVRNPFHNLTFYVIGVADRDRTIYGQYGTEVQAPAGGWLVCRTRVGRWVWLPFVSYTGPRIKAYIGWRPAGAFGIKFNIKTGVP